MDSNPSASGVNGDAQATDRDNAGLAPEPTNEMGREAPQASAHPLSGAQPTMPNIAGAGGPAAILGGHPSDDDPFDPEKLRLSQAFTAAVGVRKLVTTVPVRKPDKTWFVRTHPDPAYRLATMLLRLKEDRETYLVDPPLSEALATEPTVGPGLLITSMTRQGVLFLWEVPLPGADGKQNPWHRSALDAAETARTAWVRLAPNMALGAYDVTEAPACHAEPSWPDLPMGAILKIAFRDKFITGWDHPILRRLRGEV
jgi:hypothetical protein